MVQISGKTLIASSKAIVGVMNSQAMARSDMPCRRRFSSGPGVAEAAAGCSMSIVALTFPLLSRSEGYLPASLKSFAQSFTRPSSACCAVPWPATT